jgi:hypothetical protein
MPKESGRVEYEITSSPVGIHLAWFAVTKRRTSGGRWSVVIFTCCQVGVTAMLGRLTENAAPMIVMTASTI